MSSAVKVVLGLTAVINIGLGIASIVVSQQADSDCQV